MSLQTRLADLITAVGADIKSHATRLTALEGQPKARVYNSADISMTTGTAVLVTFNSERFDTAGIHSISSNTSRLTAPVDGLYLIGASIAIQANATGPREVYLRLDGTTALAVQEVQTPNDTSVFAGLDVHAIYQLTAGQYIEVIALQKSTITLNLKAVANYTPEAWMYRLGN